jgi:hypothetical protein
VKQEGKVRYIGVSNFDVPQMKRAQGIASITSLQPPYPRERKTPQFRGGDINDLAATSQGSLLPLNVGFQDVDWGSTTRGSEAR